MDAYTRITTDETLREKRSHGSHAYPFRYYLEDIGQFDLHCIDWHWHTEVEFVYLREGSALCRIGSQTYRLDAGQGIFINTQVIHRFEAEGRAIIPNIVFSPSLLAAEDSLIYARYLEPVLLSGCDCAVFSRDVPWQRDVLTKLLHVFALQEGENQLDTVCALLALWGLLKAHLPMTQKRQEGTAADHAQLQRIMQYIHANYPQSIALDDLAKAARLSKSSVLKLFQRELHVSPIRYLIRYRLQCAAKLLHTAEGSVAQTAQTVGFENTSYFCRKFKALFGVTPSEYRKARKRDV